VEIREYVELRTSFSDNIGTKTITIRYIVVNAFSAYNLLLGRPFLNRLGAIVSTVHMEMKLPSLEGEVIIIKCDQKTTQKCYESSLKNKKGTYAITVQAGEPKWFVEAEAVNERQSGPTGEVQEREIKGKKFKLGTSLCKELKDKIANVILENMNAFAWSSADMPRINPNFLCRRLTMDERVKFVV